MGLTVSDATESASLAARHDCQMHTHLGEARDEVAYCQEKFSCRPVDYFEEVGWMSERVLMQSRVGRALLLPKLVTPGRTSVESSREGTIGHS
jgi:hypothetical protein